jgi:hypothetical protein
LAPRKNRLALVKQHMYIQRHVHANIQSRVARFFLPRHFKVGKNIPNDQEIYQMCIKYTIIFYCKTIKNSPYLGFFYLKYTIWFTAPAVASVLWPHFSAIVTNFLRKNVD